MSVLSLRGAAAHNRVGFTNGGLGPSRCHLGRRTYLEGRSDRHQSRAAELVARVAAQSNAPYFRGESGRRKS